MIRTFLAIALLILGGCVWGCTALTTEDGRLDVDKTTGLVTALGNAGFSGQFSLSANGEAEGMWMTGLRFGSPGTHMDISGAMNPAATQPK